MESKTIKETRMSAICAVCQQEKEEGSYSKSQWRKRTKGEQWPKCKYCKTHKAKAPTQETKSTSWGMGGMDMSSLIDQVKEEQKFADFMEKVDENATTDVKVTGEGPAVGYVHNICKMAVRRMKTGYPKICGQAFEIARKWSLDRTEREFVTAFVRHARMDQEVALSEALGRTAGVAGAAAACASAAVSADGSEGSAKTGSSGVYNVSKALRRIEQYCVFCTDNFELFNTPVTEAELMETHAVGSADMLQMLYNPKERNPLVMSLNFPTMEVVKKLTKAPSRIKENVIKEFFLMQHRLMYMPDAHVKGMVFLADYKTVSLKASMKMDQMWKSDRKLEAAQQKMFQGIFPIRMTKICMINEPWWMRVLMAFIKPFLSKKMKSRIHLLGTDKKKIFESLLPARCLHKDNGGELDKLDNYFERKEFSVCKDSPLEAWSCSSIHDSKKS